MGSRQYTGAQRGQQRAKGEGQDLNRDRDKADMADADKQAEIDRKKAEVRARLEAQAAGKKAKKGFMTPERKKKLRLLLRKKAAEELKKEQERKAQERRKVIDERCWKPKSLESASEDALVQICKEYFDRMYQCESQKYDMEFEVRK